MPFPFPFTMFGANRSSNSGGGGASCDFTYCYGGDWVQGKVGNYGMSFNGTNEYILSDTLNAQYTDKITIAGWVKADNFDANAIIASEYRYTSANERGWAIGIGGTPSPNGYIRVFATSAGDWTSPYISLTGTGTALVAGTWTHVAVVIDASTPTAKIYINGSLDESGGGVGGSFDIYDSPVGYTLGGYWSGGTQVEPFAGSLDEMAVWNTELTSTEISELYNSGAGARADSITPPNASDGAWVAGVSGSYALDFNGTTDYVSIGAANSAASNALQPSSGTYACWVNMSVLGHYTIMGASFANTGGANNKLLTLQAWNQGGQQTFYANAGDGTNLKLVYNVAWSSVGVGWALDTWHHLAMTWESSIDDPDKLRMYVNGNFISPGVGSFDGGSTFDPVGDRVSREFNLGVSSRAVGFYDWGGKLDDVAVWDVVLDPAAIASLMGTPPSSVSSSNLVSYWNMEDGPPSTTLADQTANGYDGTLTGFSDLGTTGSLLVYYDWEIGDSNPVSGNFPTSRTVYDVTTASFHPSTAHNGTMNVNMDVADFGAWGQGKLGKYSFLCDGVDTSINIASSSYLPLGDGNESFSISFWANNPAGLDSYETIIGRHSSNTAAQAWTDGYNIQYNHGQSQTMRFSVGSYYNATDQAYKVWGSGPNTTFRHVVATYNTDTDVSQLWVDGVKGTDGAKSTATPLPGTGDTRIGVLSTTGLLPAPGYTWPGNIDEVSFWDGVLDTGSIANLAAGAKANAITTATGSSDPGNWVAGVSGSYALAFDGIDDYIQCGTVGSAQSNALQPSSGTIAGWFWIGAGDETRGIIGAGRPAGGGNANLGPTIIQWRRGANLTYYANVGDGSYYAYSASPADSSFNGDVNSWVHLAMTWKNPMTARTDVAMYRNGVQIDDNGGFTGTSWDSSDDKANREWLMGLHSRDLGSYWSGSMDAVGVWDVVLDNASLASLPGTAPNAISSSNLLAYWNMEDGPGSSTLTDQTGNGYNGTLTNMNDGAAAPAAATLSSYLDMECDGPGSTNVLDLSGNSVSGTLVNSDAGTCGEG